MTVTPIGSPKPKSVLEKVKRITFPKIVDHRGNLSFIEGEAQVPFVLRRVYYLYDVPAGSVRAGHAHYKLQQVIIAASGSFDIHLDDGHSKGVVTLNRPDEGLLMGAMMWREIHNFSAGAFCLVLASECYDEADYIREYDDFIATVHA